MKREKNETGKELNRKRIKQEKNERKIERENKRKRVVELLSGQ